MGNCNSCLDSRNKNEKLTNSPIKEKKNKEKKEKEILYTTNLLEDEPKNRVLKVDDLIIHSSLLVQESSSDPFDIYEFLEVLGEGSYGKVNKVIHKKLNIIRAMKIIDKRSSNGTISEENTKDLIREINILKSLDHPNIIKIYEYFNTKNKIYITFEYCSGGELFDKISSIKNFKESNIAYLLKQLISAVNFLHSNGIIHRDLKPENIILENKTKEGEETFIIKLIDFGTSQIYANKTNTKKRKFKECIGSSYYMAPEVISENYNEKCDCWSLGIIMYMLLSGIAPFNGSDDNEIIYNIKNSKLEFPKKYFENISKEAINLIKNLLNRDVEKRFSMKEALEHEWLKKKKLIMNENNKEKKEEVEEENFDCIDSQKLEIIKKNLRKFNSNLKFQQACVSYIVHNMLKKEEIEEYRKIFQKFDTSSDGRLTREELIKGFSQMMSKGEANNEVNRLFDIIDNDKNNFIEFEEFLSAFMDKKKLLKEENLMETFLLFDNDRSGKISIEELKKILSGNSIVDNNVWNSILIDIDKNSDGEISYEEFKMIMKKMIN
jgi:calcium-dependent protein kinase